MISYDFNKDCCGCAVCVDACPKKCIKLGVNPYGFVVPEVDASVCVDCHLCEMICPVLNPARVEYDKRQMFSAKNKDEQQRSAGSSGSIFYLLAKYIIDEGGIVYGAAFDEDFQLRHRPAENIQQIPPLLRSKYLQSNTEGIYSEIRKRLKDGRKVLFVGTPCQCNALYNFLGKKKPVNLSLVDFICHGVPSQRLFDDAKAYWERKNKSRITKFEFRHKRPDCVHSFYLEAIDMDSGESYSKCEKYDKYPFYNGFKRYICFRESCYHCAFAVQERVADITLADFWNIESVDPNVDIEEFNKGYSMIVTNSERGKDIFNKLSCNAVVKEFNVELAVTHNSAYTHPVKDSMGSKTFRFLYKNTCYPVIELLFFTKFYRCVNKILSIVDLHKK